jgi:hypothetical protein
MPTQTGPSTIQNTVKQSPSDIAVTTGFQDRDQKRQGKLLKGALSQGNQATYTSKGQR